LSDLALKIKNTCDLHFIFPQLFFSSACANPILPLSLLGLWLVSFRDELALFQTQLSVWNVIDCLGVEEGTLWKNNLLLTALVLHRV